MEERLVSVRESGYDGVNVWVGYRGPSALADIRPKITIRTQGV